MKIEDKVKKNPYILMSVLTLKLECTSHPTCDGCKFKEEHIGCLFRGKTPREW